MNRRNLLKLGLASAGGLLALRNAEAQTLACKEALTPAQTKGPFYPVVDQLDKDADLVQVQGHSAAAQGQVILVEGIVTDQACAPVAGILVEIWQACESGRYNHPSDPNTAPLDPNFQYWGKAITDAQGKYKFRTILPGAYPADTDWMRPPHIHFRISGKGYRELITQMYFAGEALNSKDLILQDLTPEQQAQVIVDVAPKAGSPHPVGVFNIQIEKIKRRITN